MIVNCVNNISYPNKSPSFKHYFAKKKTLKYSFYTDTEFFRQDLKWDAFVNLLHLKYKNADKVNIICHACSDGEEAYSLALKLIAKLGDEAEKFFPIIARDIDYGNIELAKSGTFVVDGAELNQIYTHSKSDISKYFDIPIPETAIENYAKNNELLIKAKDILKDKIIFEQGDIFKDLEQLPQKNTVLMCRNFWPYMPYELQQNLAEKLGKYIDDSSLVIVGGYDLRDSSSMVSRLLENNGLFSSYNNEGIYSKSQDRDEFNKMVYKLYNSLNK